MKIELGDTNNRNYYIPDEPTEVEYEDFKEGLIELNIKENKKSRNKRFVIKAKFFEEPIIVLTEMVLDSQLKIKSTDCNDCRWIHICRHIVMIVKYINEYDLGPGLYRHKLYDDVGKFIENFRRNKRRKQYLKTSQIFLKNIANEDVVLSFDREKNKKVDLVPELKAEGEYDIQPYLTFKIGNEKKYVVRHIVNNLLESTAYNQVQKFGKELELLMSKDVFSDEGKEVLDYIYRNKEFVKSKKLSIDIRNIDDLYDLSQSLGLEFFRQRDFEFSISIEEQDGLYQFKHDQKIEPIEELVYRYYSEEDLRIVKHYNYMITSKRIYDYDIDLDLIEYMDINPYESSFLNYIHNNKLFFTEEDIINFIEFSKDKFDNIDISLAVEFIENLQKEKTYNKEKVKLYLDLDQEENLLLRQVYKGSKTSIRYFAYKNALESISKSAYNVLISEENKTDDKYMDMDTTIMINSAKEFDDIIENLIPVLYNYADIYQSDVIKNINTPKRINLSVGVRVKSNLLEINLDTDLIPRDELYGVLNNYRRKKKYYKLKNGQRIFVDQNDLEKIDRTIKELDISDKDLKKSNIKLPNYRMYQVSNLNEEYMDVDIDKSFNKFFTEDKYEIDENFIKILRPYQIEGVEWLLKLRSMNLNGILADDMGLGKSIQVIAYLESIKNKALSLIVCPASLILNWDNEFKKFDSKLKIQPIHGSKEERLALLAKIKDGVIITSYDYLKRDIDKYKEIGFDNIIIDEAQYIKNYKTKAAKSVKEIKANHRIALTGTPIENSLAELWSIFDFLMKGYLYSYSKFSKLFEKPIVLENNSEAEEKLKKLVEPFVLRRLKGQVLTELPEKIEENYYVEQNEEERKIYIANLSIANKIIQGENKENKIEILAMLTKLRQLCIDPRLVYENISETSSKIKAVIEIIDKAIENKNKILVFSNFTSVLSLIEEELNKDKISYYILTGQTNKTKRKKIVDEFQKDDTPVFLISLKAGGTGLNLTKANVVIHVDPWWNQAAQDQATDRTHRIGQENIVHVFNVLAKDTIEEKIQKMQESKKELSDTFIENSKGSFANMSKDEIIELFKM